jgi:hypothetical protein
MFIIYLFVGTWDVRRTAAAKIHFLLLGRNKLRLSPAGLISIMVPRLGMSRAGHPFPLHDFMERSQTRGELCPC